MKQGGHVTPGPAAAAGLLHGQPGLASGHQAGLAMGAVQPFSRPLVCLAWRTTNGIHGACENEPTTHGYRLVCGHIFHHGCAKALLERRWNGPAISFGFADCPLCKRETGLNLSQ
jgi:hypothetical protein